MASTQAGLVKTGAHFPAAHAAVWRPASVPAIPVRFVATIAPSKQVLTWLLFPPLLTLIARQVVLLAGPARTAAEYQYGSAVSGARGAHYDVYINALYLLCFVVAGWRGIWTMLQRNLFLSASLLLAGLSVLWSPDHAVTLQMTFKVALCSLFAVYLYTRLRTEDLMALLMLMGVTSGLLSVLFAVGLPSYGIFAGYAGGAWQGICDHKNTLAISMAYLLTPVFYIQRYQRWKKVLYALLLLFLIGMSQARGPWLDTAGMLLFVGWLFVLRRLRDREARLFVLVTFALTILVFIVGATNLGAVATMLGKDPSITGRTGIYEEVWRSILKKPFLGYGFGTFWSQANPECYRVRQALAWPNIGYSESGILEVILQTGFLGGGLIGLMLGTAFYQGARLVRSRFYTPRVGWYLTMLTFALLTNLDDGWFMIATCIDWVMIIIACVGLNHEFRLFRKLAGNATAFDLDSACHQ